MNNENSKLPSQARVVVIGGGCVGASCLYHLAKAGWSDCILLEKNELTAGSTWHAAGNVPTFSSSWAIMNIQRYSTELYRRLADEVDYPMNYHVTGSIRLAHSKNRMQEFERAKGMGLYQGMNLEICNVEELKTRYPFLETHDLAGGLYDPNDGDIDPAQLTQALAKGARDMGAKIIRFCPATGVKRENDEWIVETPQGEVKCEYVVNAAGYYAKQVGEWFKPFGGRDTPMMTMSHQYLLTDPIEELEKWSKENNDKLPLLRDVDSSYYLRQEKYGLNLGPYENNCKGHWIDSKDPMPEDFSFQLFPDDLERIEWHIEDAMARVPLLAKGGVNKVINGPIPYTPDGNPLIGPMPGVPNAFEACVFTFGICQAGGAGKVLTEWITEGGTEQDMWAVDPRRFTGFCDDVDYCNQKGMEVYGNEYAMHFPHHEWPAGRDKRLSPVHDKIISAGGVMGAYNGWERANWFAKDGDDTSLEATHTWNRKGPWQIRVKEECENVRDNVGILDLPGFSRFVIEGDNVAEWLETQITGTVPKVGRVGLGYFSDDKGRIITEMSMIRLATNKILLITAATAEWHDYEWVKNHVEDNVNLTQHSSEYSCFIVTGPKSRDLLSGVCEADLSLGWLSWQDTKIAGHEVLLLRVSFAGELGWEIHAKNNCMDDIHSEITKAGNEHGLKPFGMYALNALRLEKGYRAWKGDLSSDYTILQGGLERFVKWEKDAFRGKAAMENEKQQGVTKRFVTLVVEAGECDAPYMSTLWKDGEIIGETTSGGFGYRVNKSIALGMVKEEFSKPDTKMEVEIYGERYKAIVQEDKPLWDDKNERLRG